MLLKLLALAATPALNLAESLIDTVRESAHPAIGSVVYCDLVFGYMEHSGIYVGNNKIVHLSSLGEVEAVTPPEFVEGTTAMNIYISCKDDFAIGSSIVSNRALDMLGHKRDYNFLINNCHQFSAGCLTGDFENNACNFLWMLKDKAEDSLQANTWRQWDIDLF